jgi:hypothetical protein
MPVLFENYSAEEYLSISLAWAFIVNLPNLVPLISRQI